MNQPAINQCCLSTRSDVAANHPVPHPCLSHFIAISVETTLNTTLKMDLGMPLHDMPLHDMPLHDMCLMNVRIARHQDRLFRQLTDCR